MRTTREDSNHGAGAGARVYDLLNYLLPLSHRPLLSKYLPATESSLEGVNSFLESLVHGCVSHSVLQCSSGHFVVSWAQNLPLPSTSTRSLGLPISKTTFIILHKQLSLYPIWTGAEEATGAEQPSRAT